MEYARLGSTGLIVSRFCLGTMTFGNSPWKLGGVTQSEADRLVSSSLDAGITFFDTADVYSGGESEAMLGKALGARRHNVIIATKIRSSMNHADRNAAGLSRAHILRGAEESLRRLNTDWIDLYQVHGWDPLTPLAETLSALDDLVRAGKVRYIGFSNYAAWQAALSIGISVAGGFERFVSAQMYYSLLCRDIENEIVPFCRHEGIALLPWSPLAGGMLSGKYSRSTPPPAGSRFGDTGNYFPSTDPRWGFEVVDLLTPIAARYGSSIARVSLSWMLSKPFVTSIIIGARDAAQLDENLGAAELALHPDDLMRIDEATRPPARYPAWMIDFQSRDRKM